MADQVPALGFPAATLVGTFLTVITTNLQVTGTALLQNGVAISGGNAILSGQNMLPGADNSGQIGGAATRFNTMFAVLGQFDTLSVAGGAGFFLASRAAFTNNAGAQVGTLTNSPTAGNPTRWVPVNDNGTTRNVPMW